MYNVETGTVILNLDEYEALKRQAREYQSFKESEKFVVIRAGYDKIADMFVYSESKSIIDDVKVLQLRYLEEAEINLENSKEYLKNQKEYDKKEIFNLKKLV
jgi:hypothetical protein